MDNVIEESGRTKALRLGWAKHAGYLVERYGFSMVPVHAVKKFGGKAYCTCPKGVRCDESKKGKHPQGTAWQEKKNGLEEIERLAERDVPFNTGVLVEESGLLVVDIDPRSGGKETMKDLVARYGRLPKTRIVRTGGEGWHYYFKMPAGVDFRATLGQGVDLKYNGMVIAENSTSIFGEYSVLDDADIAELPQWIIDVGSKARVERAPVVGPAEPLDEADPDLPRRRNYANAAVTGEYARLDAMEAAKKPRGEGYVGPEWNNTCFEVVTNLIEWVNTPEAGLDMQTMVDEFINRAPKDDGFGETELLRIIESARKKVGEKRREIPAPPIDPFGAATSVDPVGGGDEDFETGEVSGERHTGQLRMAYRLVEEASETLMHVRGIGWLYWAGSHWEVDEVGRAEQEVIKVLRKALADSMGDKELRKDVTKCESASGISGVLAIASTMPALSRRVDDLDSDPFLLNAPNGTWDFRTRSLRPHDPGDRITKVTGADIVEDPDPGAWGDFLNQVLPDESVREFLRRALGQGLLGVVLEHAFLILTGLGGNGKGVFYNTLTTALGSYGTVIDPALLLSTESGKAGGPELLQLMGARTVVGSETGEGRKMDEATMKRLTGGDKLSARNLYKPPVTWSPSHQLVYVTNHLPQVKGNDPAIWRRVRVVPFDIVVPEEKRDPELATKLEASLESVLAWVIQGYYDYREVGMAEPPHVLAATDEYQKSSDSVRRFVEEECLVSPVATATTREIFTAWQRWAVAEGTELLSEKMMVRELKRLGHESKRASRGVVWKGISPLVTQGEES